MIRKLVLAGLILAASLFSQPAGAATTGFFTGCTITAVEHNLWTGGFNAQFDNVEEVRFTAVCATQTTVGAFYRSVPELGTVKFPAVSFTIQVLPDTLFKRFYDDVVGARITARKVSLFGETNNANQAIVRLLSFVYA
jgi:hypothetical protein